MLHAALHAPLLRFIITLWLPRLIKCLYVDKAEFCKGEFKNRQHSVTSKRMQNH